MNATIDLELIRKYDKPGPRYTSYPTAPVFNRETGADAFVDYLARNPNLDTPLSLYVHIPFCKSLCWYCGCNMLVSRDQARKHRHLDRVKQEMDRMRANIRQERETVQVHLGGGTPNGLTDEDLGELMTYLRALYPVREDAEVSLEIDPRQVTASQVRTIARAGFNRVSMGVQDFNAAVQQAINRIQPFEKVAESVALFRAAGLNAINMDLIYGLPRQTPDSFAHTVDQLIALAPDRVALFNFAYVPQLKPQMKLISPDELPAPSDKLRMLERTIRQLCDSGYVYIGMDHFAKPEDPLAKALQSGDLHRNFQGYTTHATTEMLAFGMSAISMFDGLYVQNHHSIADYERAIGEGQLATCRGYLLDEDDRLRRTVINRFMCRNTIEPRWIENPLGVPFDAYFPGVRQHLQDMVADGLLETTADGWHATFLGRLLMRNVAMLFDRYLPGLIKDRKASFSRTV